MADTSASPPRKQRVNITLDQALVAEARAYGLNLSEITSAALLESLRAERKRRWSEDNREAIEAKKRWIEKHGTLAEQLGLI
ncbi:MAG: type II toxin-antitoxin system CcdA family antitoxin [Alphaproteobacteria bacterium]|nr:type II toxin-antitoxin system CcdA family antitoxin [Alphaproteobacteria bacterium]